MKPTMKPKKPTKPKKPVKSKKPVKARKPMKKGGLRQSQKLRDSFYNSQPIPYERRAALYDTRMGLAQKMRDVGDYIGEAYIRFKDRYKRWLEDREDRKANIPHLRSSLKPPREPPRESQQRESLRESSKHKLLPLPPPQQRMSRSTNTKNSILPLPLPPHQRILRPLRPLPSPQQRIPY